MLLQNGIMVDDYADFQEKAKQFDADITASRYPRSLFGVSSTSFYFMTVDGRSPSSIGLFLHECAMMAQVLGATDALNLDGGGSSMLVVNGCLINGPRTFVNQPEPAERPIPTALLARRRVFAGS
jgi:exopolysaccharide biosynthesis protein